MLNTIVVLPARNKYRRGRNSRRTAARFPHPQNSSMLRRLSLKAGFSGAFIDRIVETKGVRLLSHEEIAIVCILA